MVKIEYEITIYIYKENVPSKASPLNPHWLPDPTGGEIPSCNPLHGGVYSIPRCTVFMGYKHG
jgi:hypothetical protein